MKIGDLFLKICYIFNRIRLTTMRFRAYEFKLKLNLTLKLKLKLKQMNIQLLSCDAARPDRRAIAKTLETIADGIDGGLARELTDILLDGTPVDIEVSRDTSSAFRALRKLQIDYQMEE